MAAGERSTPRGTLSLAAPVCIGEDVLRPILDAFLDAYPTISAKLNLLDQPTSLIDEGVDVALRVGHLPDSSQIAVRVGEVRRILCAAPSYLAKHPPLVEPGDLVRHQIIATTQFGPDSWSFPPADVSALPRTVHFRPRVVVNSVRAAIASAVDGRGVARLFSYQVAEHVRDGRLQVVLKSDEHGPVPVHVVTPEGRLSVPKVRAFVDFVVPRLRGQFSRLVLNIAA